MTIYSINEIVTIYSINETESFSDTEISHDMFGANFVTSFDFEFVNGSEALGLLKDLGITTLRFPGGTVTEMDFADLSFITGNWDVDTFTDLSGNIANLTTLHEFFESAATIGADVSLVIPTRVAFEQSAGQALHSGNYGSRTDIDSAYFSWLDAYVQEALAEASSSGVNITQFEIGNEFWGSGQMTASEYGFLAAKITAHLGSKYPAVDLISQIVASTNEFSPLNSKTVFLEAVAGGDFVVHREQNWSGNDGDGWIPVTMLGQGNVRAQVTQIADAFSENADALRYLDGLVDHVYFDGGFKNIDDQRDFALNYPFSLFSDKTGLDDLGYFVTEWSPRNTASSSQNVDYANSVGVGNANGLQLAHTTVESFFELTSNGVDGANFWPLTFGNPNVDGRVLIDTSELDLTFSGAAFQLLATSVGGLKPVLDFEIRNRLDVHGFENDEKLVLFVGERWGFVPDHQTSLDLNDFAPSQHYFVNVTTLKSDDGSYDQVGASPIMEFHNGYMQSGDTVSFAMSGWDLSRVELQAVTNKGDRIFGREGNDTINGFGGNDFISGGGGSNSLYGGSGFDTASFDGNRSDYALTQSARNPAIWTVSLGNEVDTLKDVEAVQFADGTVYLNTTNTFSSITVGSITHDTLIGSDTNDLISGGRGNDRISGLDGRDNIHGEGGHDHIYGGQGFDIIGGGDGNDFISGGENNDRIFGDDGADRIFGNSGDDLLVGGNGTDTIFGGSGEDRISGNKGNDKIKGGDGADSIFGGDGNDKIAAEIGHDVVFGGGGNDVVFGGIGHDKMLGKMGHDRMFGGGGNDHISGNSGNDKIKGGDGADSIFGGDGNDSIFGGDGNDSIFGGDGNDWMVGGRGRDSFVFTDGKDKILDFNVGFDRLLLDDNLWGGQLSEEQVLAKFGTVENGNLVLDFGQGDVLTINGINGGSWFGDYIDFI